MAESGNSSASESKQPVLSAALEIAYNLRGAPTAPVVVLIAGLGDPRKR